MYNHQDNNNNSTLPVDLTYIYTLSIVKIKSIGNQTNSPKIRKDSNNHLRKLVLINTFIERKMAVYEEILKSKRCQHLQKLQKQQLVHQFSPPLTPPPSPPMNKHLVVSPQNVKQKPQQHQQPFQKQKQQHTSQQKKKAGYSYGGGFKRVQQQQQQQQQQHHRQQRQRPFQAVQPIQIYSNQVPNAQRTGFNLVQQPPIHWIPVQIPSHHHHRHQMNHNVNHYSMVQTQEQQLYLQQHVFLPPHPRGPHAQPLHLAKLVRRPQLVRM